MFLISPSFEDTLEACLLRAWWRYGPLKIREPQKSYQADGQRWHKQVEDYLLYGAYPPEPQSACVVNSGFLPTPPWPKEYVEADLRIGHYGSGDLGGRAKIDLIDSAPLEVTIDGATRQIVVPRLTDHKFRASKSAKDFLKATDDELKVLAQPLIYTIMVLLEQCLVMPSIFRWLIVDKKACTCRPRTIAYAPGEAVALWQEHHARWEPIIRPLLRMGAPTKSMATGAPHRCKDYGGCFYAPRCRGMGIHTEAKADDVLDIAGISVDEWGAAGRDRQATQGRAVGPQIQRVGADERAFGVMGSLM